MKYKVYAESKDYYYIKHYSNIYDYNGTKKIVSKRNYWYWSNGKIDITDKDNIKIIDDIKPITISITQEQKEIMELVLKMAQDKQYILESIIDIERHKKSLITATIKDDDILKVYGLSRIRANNLIKQKLGITSKGYPFLIVKNKNLNWG